MAQRTLTTPIPDPYPDADLTLAPYAHLDGDLTPPRVVVENLALHADDLTFLRFMVDDTKEAPWMSMGGRQYWSASAFATGLRYYLRTQGVTCYVGVMLPVGYQVPGRRTTGMVSPDTFVSFVEDHERPSYQAKDEGVFPAFVLEVVSPGSVWRDRQEKRRLYGLLGAREYALFEPLGGGRFVLEGYHRDARGRWVRWAPDGAGRLWSAVLGLHLVGEGGLLRAVTRAGVRLPLLEESEAARIEAEQGRADEAAARLKAEARMSQTEDALAREATARLEAESLASQKEDARARVAEENIELRREIMRLRGDDAGT